MLTSGTGATDSARGGTTIIAGHSTPPLIDLDDAEPYGYEVDAGDYLAPPRRAPLALNAGAGVTPTDKLKALLRQMNGDATIPEAIPERSPSPPPAGAMAPPATLRRSLATIPSSPEASPPRAAETDDENTPPTPPPRITNPYLYSRRTVERREHEERVSRSPSPPRRLPSRAVALRAAAQAAASKVVEPEPAPQREYRPSALETFIASHPDPYPEPSSSRTRLESSRPRPASPKGKERAYVSRLSEMSRTQFADPEVDSMDEDEGHYRDEYDERSPPRRRGLTPRRVVVDTPPDTSEAFAAGVDSVDNEYDLEEDSVLPWREDDTVESLDSGIGRQRYLAAERSQSRSRELHATNTNANSTSQTNGTMSFATAPSSRTRLSMPADTSLPPIPDPESSDDDDARAMRYREQLLRPFSRDSTESPRLANSKSTVYQEARSRRSVESETTNFDTAHDSARFDALRGSSGRPDSFPDYEHPRGYDLHYRSNYTRDDEHDAECGDILDEEPARLPQTSPAPHLGESLRERANGSPKESQEAPVPRDSPRESPSKPLSARARDRESSAKVSPPRERREPPAEVLRKSSSPRYQRDTTESPALDDSDTLPAAEASRLRESASFLPERSSLRGALPARSALSRSNVRWSPEVEMRTFERTFEQATEEMDAGDEDSWTPEAQEHSTPIQPQRRLEHTLSREERTLSRERTPSREELAPVRVERTPPKVEHTPPRIERTSPQNSPPREKREREQIPPATPAQAPRSTSPESTPPRILMTPASKRPAPAPAPVTPMPAVPATPANLRDMKTPRPPGAWGTPILKAPAPPPAPAADPAVQELAVPSTPASRFPSTPAHLKGMKTPRLPGAWGTPIPKEAPAPRPEQPAQPVRAPTTRVPLAPISGLPATPSPQANMTLTGLPTPRPPGAWQNSLSVQQQQRLRNLPTRFSSLRNEVLFDSSVSSAGSGSTLEVSHHRLRSPKRSPPRKEPASPTLERGSLLTSGMRTPTRSPVWGPSPSPSPAGRVVSSAVGAAPLTPTKTAQLQLDDSLLVDPDTSWAGRLQRIVMSPIRRPPASTVVADEQERLVAAIKASAEAKVKVEDAQRAWDAAVASVPADSQMLVSQAPRKGRTLGQWVLLVFLQAVFAWLVFRVAIDYALSSRFLSLLDPWHPQLASYALDVPVPKGLQAFVPQRAPPTNLFDILDMIGITGGGAGSGRVRPPT